ncbi:MAG: hypothetical protein Q9180_007233 [Flavoplaca navasiana]
MEAMTESQTDEGDVTADQYGGTTSTLPSSSATELSPVWTGMPRELVCMVVERSADETLYNWSCTNKFYYNFAADVIWESFCVHDVKAIGSERTWHRIDALRSKISFQTKSLAQRVRKLSFLAIQGSLSRELLNRRLATRSMNHALTLLPDLRYIHLRGHVHSKGFDALTQNRRLQILILRRSAEILRFDKDASEETSCGYTLKFASLAGLTLLRWLGVGRLTPNEAPGLAVAVRSLNLTVLQLSAAPPADLDDPRSSYAGTGIEESPIQIFLETVVIKGTTSKGHLPRSLDVIQLEDIYRPFRYPNEDLLLAAIQSDVQHLDLIIKATKPMK